MSRTTRKKRLTLSDHLALRAQEAEKKQAQEQARIHSIQALKELDAQALCNCPACVKLRQMNKGPAE